ncbi:MAG: hypothetical protein WB762_21070 [Candidatus Sulfotelmatobacter sp.]
MFHSFKDARLHFDDRRAVLQSNSKTYCSLGDSGRAQFNVRFVGIDIDEDRESIVERFADLPEAVKGLFNVSGFSLDLYRDKIALTPVLARSRLEWHMDDDVGPNSDSMIVYPFLVFLFDNRIAGQRGADKSWPEHRKKFALVSPLRFEQSGFVNRCQGVIHDGKERIPIH